MIAVFTSTQRIFNEINFFPSSNFVRVKSGQCILGRKFDGAITYYNWYENEQVLDAYYYLEKRQPELFKKTKGN